MSLEMEELKEWIGNPATVKFGRIMANLRLRLFEDMSKQYKDKDLITAGFGGCEALQRLIDFIAEGKKEENLQVLLELFIGGENGK